MVVVFGDVYEAPVDSITTGSVIVSQVDHHNDVWGNGVCKNSIVFIFRLKYRTRIEESETFFLMSK